MDNSQKFNHLLPEHIQLSKNHPLDWEKTLFSKVRMIFARKICSSFLPIVFIFAFTATDGAAEKAGEIINIWGEVELLRPSAQQVTATAHSPLFSGDIVKTGPYGRAAILLIDGTMIRLSPNSILEIKEPQPSVKKVGIIRRIKSFLKLTIGAACVRTDSMPRIDTPAVSASVRGTDFCLKVREDGESSVIVMEGFVECSNDYGMVIVGSGEMAIAKIGEAPIKKPISIQCSVDVFNLLSLSPDLPGFQISPQTFECSSPVVLAGEIGPPDFPNLLLQQQPPSLPSDSQQSGDPSFIQPSRGIFEKERLKDTKKELLGKISVPYENSLVRGNVPVFGLAYGKDFKEYCVEYGEGKEPKEWILIKQSTAPQTKDVTPADLDDSADITIHGNLATWDTGLKSYVYLPDYPPDHPVDLNGVYTLRLVVIGKNGEVVEDRVTVEVGEAIPNAWGGIVKSKDKKVTLTIPEQSLMDSFRVISIKSINEGLNIPLDKSRKLISNVYEFREAGERFTKDAILEIGFLDDITKELDLNQIGIYGYNPKDKKWVYLKSTREEKQKKIITAVRELSPYYAIFASNIDSESSNIAITSTSTSGQKASKVIKSDEFYLVRDTFEDGMDEWSNRGGDVGAEVTRDNNVTYDGTYCLKLTNTNYGGNFASNVRKTPFDVREYPIIQFDYKIPPDVKINLFVKINGRWYEIVLTDDYNEYKYKRVNISNIGKIEGIIADNNWHTAKFILYDMLRTKTSNHIIEEIIMADWNVVGYMKLKFGTNRLGATYYVDNFTITKDIMAGLKTNSNILLIDNFNQKKETNLLGGFSAMFADSKESLGNSYQLSYECDDNLSNRKGHSLKISYDVTRPGSFAGYLTNLQNLDLRDYKTLTFLIKGSKGGEVFKVGLKDRSGNESKVLVNDYLSQGVNITWQEVEIPLVAFSNIKDWKALENFSLSFENSLENNRGVVFLDEIQFKKGLKSFIVDNFEKVENKNVLGGRSWTFSHGAAAINGNYDKSSSNRAFRLSYGGNIGDLFTYAGWATILHGIDVSQCESLSLSIKGAEGGEEPNIYLDDGTFRWGVEVKKYAPVTTSWQKIKIPLKDFTDYGVDLTHIDELQVVFEWKKMSGTVYVDDIQFVCSEQK